MRIHMEGDKRPPKGGWASGSYMSKCYLCRCMFMGDKMAVHCADCAYAIAPKGDVVQDTGHGDKPSTVGEWIAALSELDPSLPLFARCKYTGEADWTKDCPLSTKGLSEMGEGEVGYNHACILY